MTPVLLVDMRRNDAVIAVRLYRFIEDSEGHGRDELSVYAAFTETDADKIDRILLDLVEAGALVTKGFNRYHVAPPYSEGNPF